MTDKLLEDLAEASVNRVVRQSIRELQRDTISRLSGDDSGLKNLWDEICVQVQCQESCAWETYDETVRAIVVSRLNQLSTAELGAVWLATDQGFDWAWDKDDSGTPPPYSTDDIVELLVKELYSRAADWKNARIVRFLARELVD